MKSQKVTLNLQVPVTARRPNLKTTAPFDDGSALNFKWNLGDNSESTSEHITRQYLNHGSYTVVLISTSSYGCSDTASKAVPVFEGPVADFSIANNCINAEFPFFNKSSLLSGSFTSDWNFGDSTLRASEDSPKHRFKRPGSYNVQVKVTSDKGCMDSINYFVTAYSLPRVYAGKDTIVEKGNTIRMNASGASVYNWYPAEGLSNPTIDNPSLQAFQTSSFIVLGKDERGCQSTDTVQVDVKEEFIVVPANVLTPDGNNLNDSWQINNIEAYPSKYRTHYRSMEQRGILLRNVITTNGMVAIRTGKYFRMRRITIFFRFVIHLNDTRGT
jgi:PKD repeat protein